MSSAITRIALFQCLAVFYSVLGIGVILKIRFGSPAPEMLATHIRDYGFLLLVLPIAWLIWACVCGNYPRSETGDLAEIVAVGLGLLAVLVVIGFIGTVEAALYHQPVATVLPVHRHS